MTHTTVNSLICQLVNNAIRKNKEGKGGGNVGEGRISILIRVVDKNV